MGNLLNRLNDTTIVLLSLSVILLAGFLLTRVTELAKLPNVTGYIISGILIGPHVLKLIPREMIGNMGFISDIALAFIAFGVGRYFKKENFKETGSSVIVITLFESLVAGIIVTISIHYMFHLDWDFCNDTVNNIVHRYNTCLLRGGKYTKGAWNEDYSPYWQEIADELKLNKRLYIAYGSNMNKSQMERRCPGAKVLGKAYLENWQLTFPHYANIERSEGKKTPALIWEITNENESSLDRYEG